MVQGPSGGPSSAHTRLKPQNPSAAISHITTSGFMQDLIQASPAGSQSSPHYSREFVTKPPRRQARRARGAVKEEGILEAVCRPTERRARPPSGLSQRRIGGCSRSLRE